MTSRQRELPKVMLHTGEVLAGQRGAARFTVFQFEVSSSKYGLFFS